MDLEEIQFAIELEEEFYANNISPADKSIKKVSSTVVQQESNKGLLDFHSTSLQHNTTWVEHACFSWDESLLATCSCEDVVVWDIATRSKKAVLKHNDTVWKVAFSRDDENLCAVSSDGCLYIWDVHSYMLHHCIEVQTTPLYACAVHPTLNVITVAGTDCNIHFYSIKSGRLIRTLSGHTEIVECLAYARCTGSQNSTLASSSKDKTIRIWSSVLSKANMNHDSQPCKILRGHAKWVYTVTFSGDGTILVSGSADRRIGVWSVQTGKLLKFLMGHSNVVWNCCFISSYLDSRTLVASASSDKTLRLWDIEAGVQVECHRNLGGVSDGQAQLFSCVYAPQRKLLAVTSYHGGIYLANMETHHTPVQHMQ